MAVDRSGRVYVFWDKGEGNQTQIYYAEYGDGTWSQQIPITSGELGAENPSVMVDDRGTVYVFYDKTDGQIYLRVHTGVWSAEEKLTSSGVNTYPSVRWSFLNNPLNGPGGRIDYVWTSKDDGTVKVLYGQLFVREPTAEGVENYTLFVGIGVGVIVLVGATLLSSLRHRSRAARKSS